MTQCAVKPVRSRIRKLGQGLSARLARVGDVVRGTGAALAAGAAGVARALAETVQRGAVGGVKPLRPRFRLALEGLEDRLAPAVVNVITTADNNNPVITAGHAGSAADPFIAPSLRSAISFTNAVPGDNTINLTVGGTCKITLAGANEDNNATGDFDVVGKAGGGNLTIQNTSGQAVTVSGNNLDRVFDVNPNFDPNNPLAKPKFTVTMQGFTITGGRAAPGDGAAGSGGGIRDQGSASLTLTNMIVTGNTATADGGGLAMENTVSTPWTLTLNNTTVSNNKAGDAGGGIDTDGTGKVFVNAGSVLSGNTAVNQGAGIWLDAIGTGSATLTVSGTDVSNNRALSTGGIGGGIGNAGNGAVTITNSSITGNSAGATGGGFGDENGQGSLTVANSTFLNNIATGNGGGIAAGGPLTSISNTEVDGNFSGGLGGGLFANGQTLVVQSSTLANNTASGNGGGLEVETTGTGFLNASSITNTTLFDNSALNNAGANGGGLDLAQTFTGDLKLLNDTINGNFASVGGGLFYAGTGNVAVQNTIVAGNTAAVAPDVSTSQLFVATLNFAQQVPPFFPSPASGTVSILLNASQSTITVSGSATGLSGTVTAAHLHNGAAGTNGPVAVDANGNQIDYTDGQTGSHNPVFPAQTFTVSDAPVSIPFGNGTFTQQFLTALRQGNIYTNIHTTAAPNGEIRGQFVALGVTFTDLGGNLIGVSGAGSGNSVFTAATDQSGTVANPLNPLLGPLQNNGGPVLGAPGNTMVIQTEALLPGSPAFGKGILAGAPTVDERGMLRGTNGTIDVGAVEQVLLAARGFTNLLFTEGTAASQTVATFTSSSQTAPAGSFTATIDWGDGTPGNPDVTTGTVTGSGGAFNVSGSHAYAEEGAYTIGVTITDGASTVRTTSTATVPESDLTVTVLPISTTEGQHGSGPVATFTDPSAGANDLFTAIINWGDNTTSPGIVTLNSPGQYTVTGDHTFTDEVKLPVSVSVLEKGVPQLFTASLAGSNNLPPNASPGTATASIVLSADESTVTINESWAGLLGNATAVHIHDAPVGQAGPVVFNLANVPAVTTGAVPAQTFAITAAQVADLLAGNFYTNIHTIAFPGGEIRGQFASTNRAAGTATVAEGDVLNGTGTSNLSAPEGSAVSGVVANFTNTGYPGNSVSDFTATIDWGDGTPANPDVTIGTVSGSGGNFSVSGSHTYADEGIFTVTVTLKDDDGGTASASASSTITITETDALAGTLAAFSPIEHQVFSGTVATFTDTNKGSPASDLTATVDWGDGTTTTGTVTGSNGSFTVSGTHTYDDDGDANVKVTLSENAPGTATATAEGTITVAEDDILSGDDVDNLSVQEGSAFSGAVANFTDTSTNTQASVFTATIDWGDGTPGHPDVTTGTVTGGNGNFTVSGDHTYADEGSYTATVTLTLNAPGTPSATVSSIITVTEGDVLSGTLVPFTPTKNQAFSGTVATFTDTYKGSPATDFTATIDWGDGTTTAGTVTGGNGNFSVSGTHTYHNDGNFEVAVALSEKAPGTVTATVDPTVTVTQDQLGQLQDQYGFHFTGHYSQSYNGLNAKWFQDRAGKWYALFSDGTLSSWTFANGQDNFTKVATVDASVYSNPQLLFQAQVTLSQSAQTQLSQLEQAHGFHFAGNYWQNYLGLNEKWLQDNSGAWDVLTTDGQLRPWQGASGLGSATATIDPAVWDHPDLLFGAGLAQSTLDQLGQLQDQYGFHITGNYSQSYNGLNAKWFQDRAGNWYALFSDGTLNSWTFANGQDNFTKVATVEAAVWTDPQLLFQAPVTLSAAALSQLGQLEQSHGFHFTGNYWQNFLGLGEKWLQDSSGAWLVLTPDGQLRPWQGASGLGSATATVDPTVWDHPDLLFGA